MQLLLLTSEVLFKLLYGREQLEFGCLWAAAASSKEQHLLLR